MGKTTDKLEHQASLDDLQQRLWIDEEGDRLEAILRENHRKSADELAVAVLTHICRFSQAIRGIFFQANNNTNTFHAIGGYAYKIPDEGGRVFEYGEGLVGQAILNKKKIHIQNIPVEQIQINLSQQELIAPSEMLIIPLEFHGVVHGALELLFAGSIPSHILQALNHFQGSIAATLENIGYQQKTQKLLQDYEKQTAEMMAQEEELRQNLEEMEAIQQAMHTTQDELVRQKGLVDSLVNSFDAMILIVDHNYRVLLANQIVQDFYRNEKTPLKLGVDFREVLQGNEKEQIISKIADAINSQTSRIEYAKEQDDANGLVYWYSAYFFPVIGHDSKIIGAGVEIRDVTDLRMQEQMLMELNEGVVAKAEELYHFNQEFEAQNVKLQHAFTQLERQNERITDSIRYAKTIQEAILPAQDVMQEAFAELFVIYRAKDIVSGDFYWFTMQDDVAFIAVADCTGHGVPGALKSMMSSTLLDEAVRGRRISEPKEILNFIQQSFLQHLVARTDDTKHIDGLSISLCKVEKITGGTQFRVTYSGSKSDLSYWSNSRKELVRLKGNSIEIGSTRHKDKIFTQEQFGLEENDVLYLYSDGYVDASDGQGKKIGTAAFMDVLRGSVLLSMEQQKEVLDKKLDAHIGPLDLRDDVTVLGIQLGYSPT